MKTRILILLALAFLASGCHRKNEDGTAMSPTGTLPGQGATVIKSYSGTVSTLTGCFQNCKQTIATNANVIDFPTDDVNVYLCRNADCSGVLPTTSCAQVWNQPATPCVTTIPNPDIVLGKNDVVLVNAFETSCIDAGCATKIPGYSSYFIQTTVTR